MKFLVATDGSDAADNALEYALRLAEATGVDLTVVHAVQPDVYAETASEPVAGLSEAERLFVVDSIEDAEQRGEDVLAEASELAAEHGVAVETELLYGDPVTRIAEYAGNGDFAGVVVGHRGLSERVEGMLGSVAKELASRSSVPVTVVR